MARNETHVVDTYEVHLEGDEAVRHFPMVASMIVAMTNPNAALALAQHQLQQQMLLMQQQSQVLAQQALMSQQAIKQLASPPTAEFTHEQRKRRPKPENNHPQNDDEN